MYNLRRTTKNPAHLQEEMGGERRERENILGTPDRSASDKIEHAKVTVPDRAEQQQEPNVPHHGEQSKVARGGTDRNTQLLVEPSWPEVEAPAWSSLTDTMKIVVVLETMERSANAAEYLDFDHDQEEMDEANRLLAIEKARNNQFEADAHSLTIAMGRGSQRLITQAEMKEEMEAVYAMNKRHLAEAAPAGAQYEVQLKDVEMAQMFVQGRAPNVRTCEQIINALSLHVGKDYSYETIEALVATDDEDDEVEEDEVEEDEIEEQSERLGIFNLSQG